MRKRRSSQRRTKLKRNRQNYRDVYRAERLIVGCEYYNPDGAEIPFDHLLDRITGADPSVTDYLLEETAKCPNRRREIAEKTLVEPSELSSSFEHSFTEFLFRGY